LMKQYLNLRRELERVHYLWAACQVESLVFSLPLVIAVRTHAFKLTVTHD
jgi:hypothetical protein